MRLMLGTTQYPSLLVEIHQEKSPTEFGFWVINGAWEGAFNNGHVTVIGSPGGDWTSLEKMEILTNNQDRLRGDYQDVFDNFDNPDYVAPKREVVRFDDMDDDIPF